VEQPAGSREVLRVEGICKDIAGVRILDEVSLTVRAGERRAVIGPNGAGKTSLFRIIAGEMPPTRGRVFFMGEEVTRQPAYQRACKGMARTFQQTAVFFELTVLENVMLACQQRRHPLLGLLQAVQRDRATRHAAEQVLEDWGLSRWAGRPARELPYGIQRRLELAMAFARRPQLLLLDEPTAGLAAADVEELVQRIAAIPRTVTVVFIDHNMKTVFSAADRITVMHHGQVLAEGMPAEIRENPAIQEAYLGVGGVARAVGG